MKVDDANEASVNLFPPERSGVSRVCTGTASPRCGPAGAVEVSMGWGTACDKTHRGTFSETLFSTGPAAANRWEGVRTRISRKLSLLSLSRFFDSVL